MTYEVALTLSGYGPTEPKTRKSRRTTPLPAYVATLLKAQRTRQLEERLRAGNAWNETGYVFTTELGQPFNPRNTLRAVVNAAKKAGLENVNVHALRHTVATLLIEGGVPDKAVADLMGHTDTRMTSHYVHPSQRLEREAMEGLSAVVSGVATRVAVPIAVVGPTPPSTLLSL